MDASPHQQYCLRWNNHSTNLQTAFNDLLQKESFTDVLLVMETGPAATALKCHKMVLAAYSAFFRTIFTEVPCTDHSLLLLLPGVKGWEMQAILEYMYQGEVCVVQDRISDLLNIAKFLRIKGLIDDEPQDTHDIDSPPPLITSTDYKKINGKRRRKRRSSPPSSPSVPYYSYPMSPNLDTPPAFIPPTGWNQLTNLSLAAESVLNPLLVQQGSSHVSGTYEAGDSGQNGDTEILRSVLGQSHADSSQSLTNPDDGLDLPGGLNGHSAFTADVGVKTGTKRRSSQEHQRKSSGKNYKLYSKEQMAEAIRKVENGECALAVATALGIPSRTLYDKVKKMGIKTQRTGKRHRSSSTSGAHFPHGIGGNRNGDIYRSTRDHDDASMALLDMAQGHGRQLPETTEISLENVKTSPSPPLQEEAHQVSENSDANSPPEDANENDVDAQDLSVQRTNVIVSPGHHHIKEENDDTSQD
ncbi:protein bric-a-brac 2-like [Diachasmimorpha longicaudata]|uniref:protein bric-a-brac 2-like n=1 Tax=Diachasmimorpha longicaudata TaxID=58733 RepID=UPI0030B884F5